MRLVPIQINQSLVHDAILLLLTCESIEIDLSNLLYDLEINLSMFRMLYVCCLMTYASNVILMSRACSKRDYILYESECHLRFVDCDYVNLEYISLLLDLFLIFCFILPINVLFVNLISSHFSSFLG